MNDAPDLSTVALSLSFPSDEKRHDGEDYEEQVIGGSRHGVSRGEIVSDRETPNREHESKLCNQHEDERDSVNAIARFNTVEDRSRVKFSQRLLEDRAKYRNSRSATALSTLLTVCNLPQRASSRSVSADRLSSVGLSNCLFVGRIAIRVNGITAPSTTPPTSHQNVAPASHAATDDSRPKAAQVTCMTAARR